MKHRLDILGTLALCAIALFLYCAKANEKSAPKTPHAFQK